MPRSKLLGALTFLIAASFGAGCGTSALRVTGDETTIERQMGEYLQEQGLSVRLVDIDPTNKVLLFDFAADTKTPGFTMGIDTQVSNGQRGAVQGRVILVTLYSHIKVTSDQLPAVLPVLNHHHSSVWAGCFYVNEKDGEIEAQWPINIQTDYTVARAQVEDAVDRLIQSWIVLYPQLEERLKRGTDVKTASR